MIRGIRIGGASPSRRSMACLPHHFLKMTRGRS